MADLSAELAAAQTSVTTSAAGVEALVHRVNEAIAGGGHHNGRRRSSSPRALYAHSNGASSWAAA